MTPDYSYGIYETTYGLMTIVGSQEAIVAVRFGNQIPPGTKENKTELTDKAASQIVEYLSGSRKNFDLMIAPQGTPFQRSVW